MFIFRVQALWQYYNSRTFRGRTGRVLAFGATGRILDGRQAIYTGQAPIVASYSSRGPDVNNALLQTADVLKPTVMAPGSSIWAAWSPNSEGDRYVKGIFTKFYEWLCTFTISWRTKLLSHAHHSRSSTGQVHGLRIKSHF